MTNENIFSFSKIFEKLEYIKNKTNLDVVSVDFKTEEIEVALNKQSVLSHDDMVTQIKVIQMTEKLSVVRANFSTGTITVNVKFEDVSFNEEETWKYIEGHTLDALRALRVRTNCTLTEAKRALDKLLEENIELQYESPEALAQRRARRIKK